MAELQKIETYLIEHPEDHAQRWNLTKKLYMACEYRDALSHLLILKRHIDWKLNHSRYLAATYYRLGRYDESIQELLSAISAWPNEIPIREQLARVYEVSQQTEDAIRVWQDILQLDTHHPIAAQTIQRLRTSPGEPSSENELRLNESDSGIDLAPGMMCPKCGARNSLEFDRCWQCHALLTGLGTPVPEIKKPPSPHSSARIWTLLIGLATVALLSAGVYITLKYAVSRPKAEAGLIVASSVDMLLDYEWFVPRVAVGCALLLAWPAILWLAAITCCDQPVPFLRILGVSLPACAVTYVLLWLPFHIVPLAFAAPLILTLIMIPIMFPVRFSRALVVWSVQGVLVLVSASGVIIAVIDVATLNHFDALRKLDETHAAEMPDGEYVFTVSKFPAAHTIAWKKTGSEWVDSMGQMALFTVTREGSDAPVTAEFLQAGHPMVSRPNATPPFRFNVKIAPVRNYELRLQSEDNTPVRVSISGLLLPEAIQR